MSTRSSTPDEWISQSEAARLRGVSRQAIGILVQNGRLRTMKVGRRPLVRRKDVLDFKPRPSGRRKKQK